VPLAVSVGVLVWLLRDADLAAVVASIDARAAKIILPALLAFGVVSLAIEALSIRRLLPDAPAGFGLGTAARVKCASYLPGLVHYAVGIGGLALLLRRRTGLPLARTASAVLLIASADLVVVLGAAATATAFAEVPRGGLRAGVVATVIGGVVAFLVLLRMPGSLGGFERLRRIAIFDALRRVPLPHLAELLALRIAFAACFVAGCASAFAAFQIPAPPALLISGILLVALVAALPIAVSGLGTSQAAFVFLFADVAPAERILAMSLVLSFGILGLRAAMGLLFARELTREAFEEARAAT
jgi:hypothetical protein